MVSIEVLSVVLPSHRLSGQQIVDGCRQGSNTETEFHVPLSSWLESRCYQSRLTQSFRRVRSLPGHSILLRGSTTAAARKVEEFCHRKEKESKCRLAARCFPKNFWRGRHAVMSNGFTTSRNGRKCRVVDILRQWKNQICLSKIFENLHTVLIGLKTESVGTGAADAVVADGLYWKLVSVSRPKAPPWNP